MCSRGCLYILWVIALEHLCSIIFLLPPRQLLDLLQPLGNLLVLRSLHIKRLECNMPIVHVVAK